MVRSVDIVKVLDFLMGNESYLRKRLISDSTSAINGPENIIMFLYVFEFESS
jgi:hypothetical protein